MPEFSEADVRRDPVGKFATQGRTGPPDIEADDTFVVGGTLFKPLSAVDDDFYSLAVRADHDLTDAEMDRVAQVLGYAWAKNVRGEPLGDPVRIDERTFEVAADSTKGSGYADENFEADALDYFVNGTPVRTTDRAGAGTSGTRLVSGLGESGQGLRLYAESGYVQTPSAAPTPVAYAIARRDAIQAELFQAHQDVIDAAMVEFAADVRAQEPTATHVWMSSHGGRIVPLYVVDEADAPALVTTDTINRLGGDVNGIPFSAFRPAESDRVIPRGDEILFKYRLPASAEQSAARP